jgi:hypothetical protein
MSASLIEKNDELTTRFYFKAMTDLPVVVVLIRVQSNQKGIFDTVETHLNLCKITAQASFGSTVRIIIDQLLKGINKPIKCPFRKVCGAINLTLCCL